ncbi:MAG TPA: ATP-dependent RNA helicase RhlE, partial [Flavobacterium alvei]|nr:ATP-dependent RNA helicase RhlE [Flavobacterium alvei]
GEAISLFSPDETVFLRDIEKLVGLKLPKENIKGFEPDPNASTEPIKQGQGRQQRNSTPRKPNTDNSNRSSNNSFGPRRPQQNNDRRSNR